MTQPTVPQPGRRPAWTSWMAAWALVLGLCPGMAMAQAAMPAVEAAPGCVGLVLGGGGARGIAHVGVLKVLEREHIPVCAISGTSMGAIVGGLYAAGYDAAELERLVKHIDWSDMLVDDPPRSELPMERKDEDFRHLLKLEIGYRDGKFSIPAGLVRGQKLLLLLRRLTLPTWQVKSFDALPIPFRAVAADIVDGQKVVFAKGDLATAIRASMSVPGAFAPVQVGEHLLVDGGIADNLPVAELRTMGQMPMVVVDVESPLVPAAQLGSPGAVLNQMVTMMMREKTDRTLATLGPGDTLLRPELGDLSSVQFQRAADAVELGERAAEAMLPQLRRYAVPAAEFAGLRARQHRRAFDPGLVAFLDVEPGQSPSATRHVAWATESLVGKPFDLDAVERQVGRAYGDGRFETIDYRLVERDGRAGLEIVPQQKPWDAFGRLGLQVDDNFNGLNNYLFSAELVFNDVNRLGARWRSLLQLGRVTGLRTEFHQPFGRAGALYLEPSAEIRAESLPLWVDGREQIAEYRLASREVGLEAGYSPAPQWRVAVRALAGRDVVRRLVGDESLLRTVGQSYAGLRASATWDSLDSVDFPTKGVRATGEWLSLHPWGGSDAEGDVARLAVDWALSRGRDHLLLGARMATAPGDEAFFQTQNFLGGFLNLSGFNEKALVGNQLGLLRAVVYRRLGETDQLFSVPTYLGTSLEAGNVWDRADDFGRGGWIVGGSMFLGLDTPLGPLFLGYGRNDAGASSFYLTFGSLLRRDGE